MITETRIPLNREYCTELGVAVYGFAYYEWIIIYIIECLNPGFVKKYCRGKPMASGEVKSSFEELLKNHQNHPQINELSDCCQEFAILIHKRNALIHAHPIEGNILNYQAELAKTITDFKWQKEDIVSFIKDIDSSACFAASVLDSIRN